MNNINIELRMFMTFKQYLPEGSSEGKAKISLGQGATIGDISKILNIPANLPKLVILNGVSHGISDENEALVLKEGDIVSIFPPAGGG
ncbi:MAG: MoaD/ThiS family protein [Pseudomonadota bacterium]